MAEHTKGPWKADNLAKVRCEADGGYGLVAEAHGGRYYGSIPATVDDLEISHANARLIAAAPDLLAAAQYLREHLALFCGPDDAIANEILRIADAAIARATGGGS